jgi:hypothetical protein
VSARSPPFPPIYPPFAQGVRILTVFIYLSNVTKGGETAFFTEPGLEVTPQAGRAVMWSQVLDAEPHVKDPRTEHEARPVLQGTKLAANFWIHQVRRFRLWAPLADHRRGGGPERREIFFSVPPAGRRTPAFAADD